jgi:hypothetical protein
MCVRASISIMATSMVLLGGCASNPPEPLMSTRGSTIVQTGRVTDVRDVAVRGGRASGVGSFIGTIVGGVAGSKIGSGTGSTVAGIGGAVAGGMAGQRQRSDRTHRATRRWRAPHLPRQSGRTLSHRRHGQDHDRQWRFHDRPPLIREERFRYRSDSWSASARTTQQ